MGDNDSDQYDAQREAAAHLEGLVEDLCCAFSLPNEQERLMQQYATTPTAAPQKGPTLNELRAGHFKRLNKHNTPLTRKGKTYRWEKHVSPEFGNKPIHENIGTATQDFFDGLDFAFDSKSKLLNEFKQYSKVLVKNGTLRRCPFDDVELRRERHKDARPKFWTEPEMNAIKEKCSFEQRTVFFGCLYGGAWRVQDARNLKIQDIDFDKNRITFALAKSGRVESRYMTPLERNSLAEWIAHKHGDTPDPNSPVFPNHKGEHFFRTYTWRLDEVREAAGVEKKGRLAHAFRHTGARHAASGKWGEKWSLAEVKKLLRDTSNAAERYFDILDEAMQDKTDAMTQPLTLLTDSGESHGDSDCESVKKPLYP